MLRSRSNCNVICVVPSVLVRRHLRHARNRAELVLQRRCDSRRHRLRVRTRELRRDLDRRKVDLRQRRHRQQRERDHADEQDARHQQWRLRWDGE